MAASREVALDVGQPGREAVEHLLVERLAGADDRLAGAVAELVVGPVVDRDADDRARQQPALLEPVQRSERHHLGQVARDPEDHEDVGRLLLARRLSAPPWSAPLAQSLSVRTEIRPGRSWVNPAQVQSTTALARSSPVDSRARCTAPHARDAALPFIVRPPRVWITAVPRPIVAIVPLSWYANGSVSLPAISRAMFSPGVLAGLERDRAELRQHVVRLRVGDPGDVADGEHLGMAGDAEVRFGRDPVAVLQLDPERVDDRAGLQARAPDQRVRLDHRARLRA